MGVGIGVGVGVGVGSPRRPSSSVEMQDDADDARERAETDLSDVPVINVLGPDEDVRKPAGQTRSKRPTAMEKRRKRA